MGLMAAFLVVTMISHPVAACPNCSVGNDDGEFDFQHWGSQSEPNNMAVTDDISNTLTWNGYPCQVSGQSSTCNTISLQYNPDRDASLFGINTCWPGNCPEGPQSYSEWFQSIIFADPNGDALFSIQVYAPLACNPVCNPVWTWYSPWTYAGNILNGAAQPQWAINEWMVAGSSPINNRITDVIFETDDCGYCDLGGQITSADPVVPSTDPGPWEWLRSNICWCGENSGSVTFTGGGGTNWMGTSYVSNTVMGVNPPNDLSTAESSNMGYGCIQSSGYSSSVVQSFQLGSHC